jgi:hypothetical protein
LVLLVSAFSINWGSPGISLELLKAPGAMLAAAGEKLVAVFFDINVDRLHVPCAVLAHR